MKGFPVGNRNTENSHQNLQPSELYGVRCRFKLKLVLVLHPEMLVPQQADVFGKKLLKATVNYLLVNRTGLVFLMWPQEGLKINFIR